MAPVETYVKTPGGILDYTLDWGSWLKANELILTSTWAITSDQPPDDYERDMIVLGGLVTGALTTVWVKAGVLATIYTVTNTITTPSRVDSRSIQITIGVR